MLQPELEQLLELAQEHHQSGRLVEAASLYRQVLADDPKHADSIYFLGDGRRRICARYGISVSPDVAASVRIIRLTNQEKRQPTHSSS
jgi:hypothetical protein